MCLFQVGDKEELSVQYASWQQQVDGLRQKGAMAQGSRQTELQAVAAAERELRAPQYTDIYQRYKKSLVEVRGPGGGGDKGRGEGRGGRGELGGGEGGGAGGWRAIFASLHR